MSDDSDFVRLRFVPKLVDNEKDPRKSVSGKIIYEKKHKNDDRFPSEDMVNNDNGAPISRQTIKCGDWTEINLDTSETFRLFEGLSKFYELHSDIGCVPLGRATYAKIDDGLKNFIEGIKNSSNIDEVLSSNENSELIALILDIITKTDTADSLKKVLTGLQEENLQHLSASLNLEKLIRVARLIEENFENGNEEFWQKEVFESNQWVLSQIFSSPFTIFAEKAYVGGKGITAKGGNICDFIYKNKCSDNVSLIEIKNPCTSLVGTKYRSTYSMSSELSGAISQVLNYRDMLIKNYYSLCGEGSEKFKVCSPKCVVVIGTISRLEDEQKEAFENFRNSLNGIVIITFDELYQKIMDLITIISSDEN